MHTGSRAYTSIAAYYDHTAPPAPVLHGVPGRRKYIIKD
jgi:hypothetical protein